MAAKLRAAISASNAAAALEARKQKFRDKLQKVAAKGAAEEAGEKRKDAPATADALGAPSSKLRATAKFKARGSLGAAKEQAASSARSAAGGPHLEKLDIAAWVKRRQETEKHAKESREQRNIQAVEASMSSGAGSVQAWQPQALAGKQVSKWLLAAKLKMTATKLAQTGTSGLAASQLRTTKKELGTALAAAVANFDKFPQAVAAFRRAVTPNGVVDAARMRVAELVELAAMKGGPLEYGEALVLCGQIKPKFDVRFFTRLLVMLAARVPAPTTMVRATLNLAIPCDGQVLPLVPPPACRRHREDILEDGEAADGNKGGKAGGKAAAGGAPPGFAKVQLAELRGCVRAEDTRAAAYFGHFVVLLHLEMLEELNDLARRLGQPVEQLRQQGWALQGLRGRHVWTQPVGKSRSGLPGKKVSSRVQLAFKQPGGRNIATALRLRPGDSVLLSRTSPLKDFVAEGLVHDAPIDEDGERSWGGVQDQIVVSFDVSSVSALDESVVTRGTWRLDGGANRTAYERQLMALVTMGMASKRPPLWDLLLLSGVGGTNVDAWASRMRELVDAGSAAATNDGKGGKGAKAATAEPAAVEELRRRSAEEPALSMSAHNALEGVRRGLQRGDPSFQLNASQRRAISCALARRLTLVQGPPGTGKTHVSVRLLELWAHKLHGMKPLLATSDSNIAVDNIADGALKRGLKVVRVGRPEKITSQLEDVTLEALFKRRRVEVSRWDGDDMSVGEWNSSEVGSWEEFSGGHDENPEEQKRRRYSDYALKVDILKEADVICTTTIAAGSDFLSAFNFGAVLIDEVAQATELSTIVPILLRGTDRLVLVGDHCQLPPSVHSLEAETRGLSLSLFGRLVASGLEPFFLDTQFRMHPTIAQFSAQAFYGGKLRTGVAESQRVPPEGFDWPQEGSGVAFIHTEGPEHREGDSRANENEASIVAGVVATALAAGELSALDVGVVTPYSAQVRSLRQALRGDLALLLQESGVDITGGLDGRCGARALEIASVDAFQGREKELIVFSAVRSNSHGNVGFLADWRRLNVMVTRARRGLIVVGDATTLRTDATWSRWLDWAEASGFVVDWADYAAAGSAEAESSLSLPPSGGAQGPRGRRRRGGRNKAARSGNQEWAAHHDPADDSRWGAADAAVDGIMRNWSGRWR